MVSYVCGKGGGGYLVYQMSVPGVSGDPWCLMCVCVWDGGGGQELSVFPPIGLGSRCLFVLITVVTVKHQSTNGYLEYGRESVFSGFLLEGTHTHMQTQHTHT